MNQERHGLLTIGSFAAATRLSLKALRLYCQLGILAPHFVDPESGYRYYHVDQLRQARLIRMLRMTEMPLATIRQALAAAPVDAERLVHEHVQAMEARALQARRLVPDLVAYLRQEATMPLEVQVRTVDPQPIISITKRVRVDKLDRHIWDSLATLVAELEAAGETSAGAPFGIYHGPVNAEDDGPMEVCIPVRRLIARSGGIAARELAGGRVAYVTMRGEQCEFPAVLEGYDAVHDWITQNGYEPAESPREIWYSAPGEDSHGDNHMEVAWLFRERQSV
ncbi:MAG TPA: MerR family transcriptional regulator [Herpetosiphonaceae bacterium]|nr:MerR family transcriptional regulator [Herpetosiphonaceae bacterium]